MLKYCLPSVILGPLLLGSCVAVADIDDTYRLSLGATLTTFNSKFGVTNKGGGKDFIIDIEDDLRFDERVSIGRLQGQAKFSERHGIRFEYLPLRRSASTVVVDDIEINDTIIVGGAHIASEFNTDILDLSYLYSLVKKPNLTVDFSAGLYIMNIGLELNAEGYIQSPEGDDPVFQDSYYESRDYLAPLPLMGLTVEYELNPKVRFLAGLRYLDLSIDGDGGEIFTFAMGGAYLFNKNWSVGAGLNTFNLDVAIEGKRTVGTFDWSYAGAQINVVYMR